jgi:hypothetical protein
MFVIVSFIFHTLCFPHEGKIAMIDQLSFVYSIPNASIGPSIPVIINSQLTTENIRCHNVFLPYGYFRLHGTDSSRLHHV